MAELGAHSHMPKRKSAPAHQPKPASVHANGLGPAKATGGHAGPGKKRIRFGPLPRPADKVQVPYALCREELKGLSDAELTLLVTSTPAFDDEVGRICDQLDAKRGRKGGKPGTAPLYSSRELELVFVFQRVCGLRAVKEARDRLAGDRGAEARRLFGFDRPRENNPNRRRQLRSGVPSEATLSRHLSRFGGRRRRGAYERLARRLRFEHLRDFPEMRTEARLLGLDGTKIETHFTCPIRDPRTKKVVNAEDVTCPDGGYVPLSGSRDKAGHGFNAVILATHSGLPLDFEITPLHEGESGTGTRLIERFGRELRPVIGGDEVGVIAADGAFHSEPLRRAARSAGLVESIHWVSHADSERSRRNAAKANKRRYPIDGYPNWSANGHFELVCKCGNGQTRKEIQPRPGKPVTVRTVGSCSSCGSVTITSGRWRLVQNYRRNGQSAWVRIQPDQRDQASSAFGNPLTFNDQLAGIYGRKRFGHGEGLHGSLVSRFGLCKGKRWFRRADQARTDTALVFSIMHSLAMEQRRRAGSPANVTPIVSARSIGPPGRARAA